LFNVTHFFYNHFSSSKVTFIAIIIQTFYVMQEEKLRKKVKYYTKYVLLEDETVIQEFVV